MPHRRRSQAERVATSDQCMTNAAIDLLVECGVHDMTLQAIGERAGYSRGLATARFGSKGGLLAHVMKTASEHWLERLQEAVGERVGAEALVGAIEALYRFTMDRPNELRAMYLLWFQSLDPGVPFRGNVAHVNRVQRSDVVRWLELGKQSGSVARAVDSQRAAEQFCATIAGIVYQWIVDPQVSLRVMCEQFKQDVRARLGTAPVRPRRTVSKKQVRTR
jgi:AcrR family transcriptional regulator